MRNKWVYSSFFLLGLMIVAFLLASFVKISYFGDSSFVGTGNVMVIPVKGVIMSEGSSDGLFSSSTASSTDIINALKKAQSDPIIEAVVLDIDSPGGSAVPSQEIVVALKKFNKTKISVVKTVGASGAYWIASATDRIFVNPLSTVGSIGVISSYLEFSGLLNDYNVSYERLVAGKYKDMGTPYRSLTDEETGMMQDHLDKVHDYFKKDVASNLGMNIEIINQYSEGQVFLGMEAVELGLAHEVGNMDDAKIYLEEKLNTTVEYRVTSSRGGLSDLLGLESDNFAFSLGRGMAYQMGVDSQGSLDVFKLLR